MGLGLGLLALVMARDKMYEPEPRPVLNLEIYHYSSGRKRFIQFGPEKAFRASIGPSSWDMLLLSMFGSSPRP